MGLKWLVDVFFGLHWDINETEDEIVMQGRHQYSPYSNSSFPILTITLFIIGLWKESWLVASVAVLAIIFFTVMNLRPYKILKDALNKSYVITFVYSTVGISEGFISGPKKTEYTRRPGTSDYRLPTFWMDADKIIIKKIKSLKSDF
ncbi:MAG: hypothetical protein ABH851_00900 [Methanobacteriota archaeon]